MAKYAGNEDNDKYGIYPEEYFTEDGYLEAIEDAKYSWREECRREAPRHRPVPAAVQKRVRTAARAAAPAAACAANRKRCALGGAAWI
ncbi:MAG: hypothetical protein LUG99_20660 [Lachnospiraceae bacterium]|nr:hypothetical protein [Lachnospiraceae bacterium]